MLKKQERSVGTKISKQLKLTLQYFTNKLENYRLDPFSSSNGHKNCKQCLIRP